MRPVSLAIIHCSDSTFGDVPTIRKWHLARGWSDIGYHYVILPTGEVQEGRKLEIIGAHCEGHNTGSVGICLIGVKDFSDEQFISLKKLYEGLCDQFKTRLTVKGHYELDQHGKTCPNINAEWLRALLYGTDIRVS